MSIFISNKSLIKTIDAPPSKSVAQRVLLASTLSSFELEINNIGASDDVLNILQICKQLGAKINQLNNKVLIKGKENTPNTHLNVGESGLGVRLTVPIASTYNREFIINGHGSLLKRPLVQFASFLPKMGVDILFKNQHLPITISGKLRGGNYTVDGSLSSQYISGLLMALPLVNKNSTLVVKSPTSTPYIDITLDILDFFNIEIEHQNYKVYHIKGNQTYLPSKSQFTVEGDWSGASFWVVYGLIQKKITINGLSPNSHQADKAILDVVKQVGGTFQWKQNQLSITSNQLKPFEFDANHCPDLFPSLVTLAAAIKGTSIIRGVKRLFYKESNRAVTLQKEFSKLGLKIILEDDLMLIKGKGSLLSASVDSNNDHRIAMSLAIATLLTPNGITINHPNCVKKSYPNFWLNFN